ncbi:MAG TPA: cobyrinate a,c-diamide synthase, partial [Bacteroidetes bacterium]|nr:cobyrinate a,c-diamide synthase [Bacteroidota bacterium]HEX05230.1 cobyrinate a,c-diamide synthase [Bacteroidota bacterium]
MIQPCRSVTVAGLSGDSGKTLVALGLVAGWTKRGHRVAPFKKGPDYIDAAWLSLAAEAPCRNLDTFLMTDAAIHRTWDYCCQRSDVSVIEGNRGLFDGVDASGSHSTAELAKRLQSPVVLVVDATKVTATLAAIVLGVRKFDPSLMISGVVLNRVGGTRHETVARESIETHTDVKVLGAIPRVKGGGGKILPGRHLGLVTVDEHPRANTAIEMAASLVYDHVDIDALFDSLRGEDVPPGDDIRPQVSISTFPDPPQESDHPQVAERIVLPQHQVRSSSSAGEGGTADSPRIAVLRDSAFSFYYPENLEALRGEGAEIVTVDSLHDSALPENIHALYIGGGFPETHAAQIAENRQLLDAIRVAAENELPIYAECGGLMLLCESIEFDGQVSRM